MGSPDKKLAVLHQLSQEFEPISLKELLGKLGDGYVGRSVRRWLAEMIKEGLLEKIGDKRGAKYKVIHRDKRSSSAGGGCFRVESMKVVGKIRSPIYERHPISYIDEWLESYEPNVTYYIPESFRAELLKAGTRSQGRDPAGTYAHQIFNRLLIDLSYNSSRLEGNTYSLLDTKRLVLEGESAQGKLDEEKVMILNHKEAIRYLVDTAHRLEVSYETICTLHYLLSDGLLGQGYGGKVRAHGVRITGSTYVPYEDPKTLERQLEKIARKGTLIMDPYEQSFFLLVHISYLQAFIDVNKRTARLNSNIPLIKGNLVPLSFNDVDRDDYSSAVIAIYELQDIRPLLDLYIFSYMRTCAIYDAAAESIGFDEIRVRYRQERRAVIREIILKGLTGIQMKEYISLEGARLIQEKDRAAFIEDVLEDLKLIDRTRIAGLGITPEQLEGWLAKDHL
ncbi:Fic family protein [Candidatus Neptunochlamydia vexilliferae]|uniref:Fido domain-containing protein n=1 Tax=Candidatus Neptunichlamydia vexilliferae TaxID=1651774 RepID=A0ABS0B0M4_9BACT|nr:Fic family protein [Candidatus Neptunochlamydia vexilliferae]MBF5059951.1 hypothetical protein [Candidatus Neptunochlamydia vexilliferae]